VCSLGDTHTQVENPVAFATGKTKLLSLWHLHAQYAGLMVAPIHMCADWSYRCVPLVEHFSDPRNLLSLITYAWVLWGVLAGRPWEIAAEILGYGRVRSMFVQHPMAMHAWMHLHCKSPCSKFVEQSGIHKGKMRGKTMELPKGGLCSGGGWAGVLFSLILRAISWGS